MRADSDLSTELENKQSSTRSASGAKSAKLTPPPSQVAPRGCGFPGWGGDARVGVLRRPLPARVRSDSRSARLRSGVAAGCPPYEEDCRSIRAPCAYRLRASFIPANESVGAARLSSDAFRVHPWSGYSTLTRKRPTAGAVGPAATRSRASRIAGIEWAWMLPRPTSSKVPTMLRTML